MKLDELIDQLQSIRKRVGNLDVAAFNHADPLHPRRIRSASMIRVDVDKRGTLRMVNRRGVAIVEIL